MKLKEIFSNGWYDRLSPFLNSGEFFDIGKELQRRIKENEEIKTHIGEAFNAFKYCPYNNLKVVFLFDELLYNKEKQDYFWGTVEREVYDGLNLNMEKNLERLGSQGVLFLSKSLTQGDSELWKPFYNFVVSTIKEYNSGIIFVGDFRGCINSRLFENWASNGNIFIPCVEPFSKNVFSERWETGGVFEMINSYLKDINNEQIEW